MTDDKIVSIKNVASDQSKQSIEPEHIRRLAARQLFSLRWAGLDYSYDATLHLPFNDEPLDPNIATVFSVITTKIMDKDDQEGEEIAQNLRFNAITQQLNSDILRATKILKLVIELNRQLSWMSAGGAFIEFIHMGATEQQQDEFRSYLDKNTTDRVLELIKREVYEESEGKDFVEEIQRDVENGLALVENVYSELVGQSNK